MPTADPRRKFGAKRATQLLKLASASLDVTEDDGWELAEAKVLQAMHYAYQAGAVAPPRRAEGKRDDGTEVRTQAQATVQRLQKLLAEMRLRLGHRNDATQQRLDELCMAYLRGYAEGAHRGPACQFCGAKAKCEHPRGKVARLAMYMAGLRGMNDFRQEVAAWDEREKEARQ